MSVSYQKAEMADNPLIQLEIFGQSIWLDFIRRGMLASGELEGLIYEDGLLGVTSNPAIFEKAIDGSQDYEAAVRTLSLEGYRPEAIYQHLAIEDIQRTADLFLPFHDMLEGGDGFVSLEVSPHLAYDTSGTIYEARRLWATVNRPNVLIKVPATRQGLPAIQQLISEGINVNVTLLFSLPRYQQVAEAYLAGLEARLSQGKPIKGIASVASFFLSRIDVLVDSLLERKMADNGRFAKAIKALHGQTAIASARIAYQMYKGIYNTPRFRQLQAHGARPQRLLWASTSTKNPAYSDLKYVEALIGPETVNTLPMETLAAYHDRGRPEARLERNVAQAQQVLARLPDAGIDLAQVTRHLENEGVLKFVNAYDALLETLEQKRSAILGHLHHA
jgi:transaldolase